jgi:hypothetical protein
MNVPFGSANMTQVLGQPNSVIYDKVSDTAFRATKGTAIEAGSLLNVITMGNLF